MLKLPLFPVIIFSFLPSLLKGQVLTTEPFFPNRDEAVTIFFDATQGNEGLADCDCDVYLHTGVLTTESQNNSDWKNVQTQWGVANPAWRLDPVPGEPNLYRYEISPSIEEYYDLSPDQEVTALAFVFRSASGSLEGKDVNGQDIIYEVVDPNAPFEGNLFSPASRVNILPVGAEFTIQAAFSRTSRLELLDNGQKILDKEGKSIDISFLTKQGEEREFELRATSKGETIVFNFSYVVADERPLKDPPAGAQAGITLLGDTAMRVMLHAPGKNLGYVIGNMNNWQLNENYRLNQSLDSAFFWLEMPMLEGDDGVLFQYLMDEAPPIPDPFSELCLDDFHDQFIDVNTFSNIPKYPSAFTQGYVSWVRNNVEPYNWQVASFVSPPEEELVIYELLVRDFTAAQNYQTLIDTLDYLERLGVNAIELMPPHEFEGNISWGYNPALHFGLDKYYGTPEAFKAFVDACHIRGIAVLIDVVFNHAFSQSPLCQLFWDEANFRPAPDNPWLNVTPRHPFNVGYDFDHSSEGTRMFVDRVLTHWLTEYRVDGFRFDLSKGFTQKFSQDDSQFRLYDTDRIGYIKHYGDVCWENNPNAVLILEHFAENRENEELAEYGFLHWAGSGPHNDFLEAAMGYASDFSDAYYGNRGWEVPNLITYIESHDEERMLYKLQQFGNQGPEHNTRDLRTALDRAELANVFFYSIPGPKMLWQFGELGYDFSINYCPDSSINDGCRTDLKPVRWDYYQDQDRRDLYEITRAMIWLKTCYDVFNTRDLRLSVSDDDRKKIFLFHDSVDVVVHGIFNVESTIMREPFPYAGTWYDFFSGDSLNVTNPNAPLAYEPGEYHLYSSVRLEEPPGGIVTRTLDLQQADLGFTAFPSPTLGPLTIAFQLEVGADTHLEVFDQQGRSIKEMQLGYLPTGSYQQFVELPLETGVYFLRLVSGYQWARTSLVKL